MGSLLIRQLKRNIVWCSSPLNPTQPTRHFTRQAMFQKDTPQEMAEHLVKVAQGHPYMSYDDVTCIVCKIEYAN